MNDSHIPDHLTGHINRTAETLAACEQNMRSAHALLQAAHVQIERSRDLHRQLNSLNRLHHLGPIWRETREPIDES